MKNVQIPIHTVVNKWRELRPTMYRLKLEGGSFQELLGRSFVPGVTGKNRWVLRSKSYWGKLAGVVSHELLEQVPGEICGCRFPGVTGTKRQEFRPKSYQKSMELLFW